MPFQNNVLAGASAQGGYQIANSLRFRASNNGYLSRTAGASPTNDKIFTWSGWVKLGRSATTNLDYGVLFTGYTGNSDSGYGVLRIRNSELYLGGWATAWKGSTALFRDPSAWYHIVMAIDTTQATASNRIKLYVNGSQLTAFGSFNNDPSQNSTMGFNNASSVQRIGLDAPASSSYNFDGYMANVYFIDGQALTPSSFGQTDATTGVWVPKAYSGTFGANGFFLQFKDAASTTTIGYDTSGNSNNFTTSGISVTAGTTFDQMLDTPTNNYSTFDAISPIGSASSIGTLASANLTFDHSAANYAQRFGSFAVASGKWYFEYTITTFSSGRSCAFGIGKTADYPSGTGVAGSWTGCVGYGDFGDTYLRPITEAAGISNTSGVASMTFAVNDVLMIAFDVDAGKFWMGKNGTWFDSGNPAAGTNQKQTFTTGINWRPWCVQYGSSAAQSVANFGQLAFSYTPPSGFKALNTANLSVPTIKKPSLYMDATLRTGTGATASVSSLGFQPDLVWIKSRSAATNHNLFDSARGVQKGLGSNLQSGQYTDANSLTAFNTNGYSLGSDASSRGVNINTNTYVDWAWKEGAAYGLDVVTFAGTGSAQAVNHNLGVTPEFIIMRVSDDVPARTWPCWHKNLTSASYYIALEGAAAETLDTTMFNGTSPTSTQFTAGSYNSVLTRNTIAYVWAGVSGFSKFDSYVGNASSDGPFVWCGFRPKWIFLKGQNIATSWRQYDAARMPNNEAKSPLLFNVANAESAEASGIDILSNGFKLRWSDNSINGSGSTYIFAAFAEAPFKYARAR
jgi:hypothetical protein